MASTLLIVEDEPELAGLLRDVLVDGGFEVVLSTGISAVARAAEVRPDGIILDYVMPGMSGADVIAEMRGQLNAQVPPIILVTGREDAETLAALLGADAFLRKPFDVEDLLALARRFTGPQ